MHQRLIDEQFPESLAVARVVDGLHQCLADDRRRAHDAIEPGVVDHFNDGRDATAGLADEARVGLVELDFA